MRRALFVALLASCAHPPGPQNVASSYLEALARGDAQAAYAMSSADVQSATVAAALGTLAPVSEPRAAWDARKVTVELEGGRKLVMLREGDAWKVRDEALFARLASDPRGAARAFLDAAIAGDVARVRPFLPEDHAADATEALAARLTEDRARFARASEGLLRALDRAPIIEGDFASIPYDPRRTIRLMRQKGRWRVLDVE